MNRAIILVALALAACGSVPAEPSFIGYASKGATTKQMQLDGAECRDKARSTAGAGQHAVYRETYMDCMISKGYEPKW